MPRYSFGPFSLDTEARALVRDGQPVPLAGKTFETLAALVENRGRLMDKDELLSRVWPGIVVEEANLSQAVFTVRKILGDNPKDPHFIATVAGRGYQFVAPVTELKGDAPTKRDRKAAIGSFAAVGVLVALAFLVNRPPKPAPELIQKRLTFNTSENPVQSAAISPDGKYLAYSDPTGIHVKLLSTSEERLIPKPAGVPADADWWVDSWFPDGTQLLADAWETGGQQSMWTVSMLGQSARQVRDGAQGFEVSPDGTRIAFSPPGVPVDTREIWLMGVQGDHPQKVLAVGAQERVYSVHWSPDGQRLAYIKHQDNSDQTSIETCDLRGARRTVAVSANLPLNDFCWLPEGRIVYARQGLAGPADANLWQIGIDNYAGTPTGKPQRITQPEGSHVGQLSASADGKRLVILKQGNQEQVYVSELAAGGTRMKPPRRLTNNEAYDQTRAWTADSKAVLFISKSDGKRGIFKQGINQETSEPVVTGPQDVDSPRLSADGAWILFVESPIKPANATPPDRLMRIPASGGVPHFVMEIKNWIDFGCASAPASLCVILEKSQDQKHVAFIAFDPLKGRGKVLRTMEQDPAHAYGATGLSPDGSTFAISRNGEPEIHIGLLSLSGGSDREISVKGWPNIRGIDWSPDGKGLYCGSNSRHGSTLLYVDLKGNARVLWQLKGCPCPIWGIPSPDGRYIALEAAVLNSNIWMLEGF